MKKKVIDQFLTNYPVLQSLRELKLDAPRECHSEIDINIEYLEEGLRNEATGIINSIGTTAFYKLMTMNLPGMTYEKQMAC